MGNFDPERLGRAVSAALTGPGGPGLVIAVFAGLPGASRTPSRRGLFRSQPERIQLGDWRYEILDDGRVRAGHLVNGIVLAEDTLLARDVGPHVARSVGQLVARYGESITPNVEAAVDALEAGSS